MIIYDVFCARRSIEISDEKRACSFVTYCICRSLACGTKVFIAGSRPLASYGEVIPCYSEHDAGAMVLDPS